MKLLRSGPTPGETPLHAAARVRYYVPGPGSVFTAYTRVTVLSVYRTLAFVLLLGDTARVHKDDPAIGRPDPFKGYLMADLDRGRIVTVPVASVILD